MLRSRIFNFFFNTTEETTFYLKHSIKIIHRIYSHSHRIHRLTPPALAKTPVIRGHHIQERDENPPWVPPEEQIHQLPAPSSRTSPSSRTD